MFYLYENIEATIVLYPSLERFLIPELYIILSFSECVLVKLASDSEDH